jgi:hypothetical protein
MKKYEVTLLLIVNPSRDIDLSTPELKRVEYIVCATSEEEAVAKAKQLDESDLSVWESFVI